MATFAEVIVPLPVQGTFTYLVPEDLIPSVRRGSRVYVPFGSRKHYTGIVTDMHGNKPYGFEVKPITALLDATPVIRHPQLKFWQWMSEYYLCTIGEVFKAALPTGLKVESETCLTFNEEVDLQQLTPTLTKGEEFVLEQVMYGKNVKLGDMDPNISQASTARFVNKLLSKGLVLADEKATSTYRPKKIQMVLPMHDISDREWLHNALDKLMSAPKQEKLMIAFLDLVKTSPTAEVERDELLQKAGVSYNILREVIAKKILHIEQRIINRFRQPLTGIPAELPPLSKAQREAMRQIGEQWRWKDVVLLHGVTGSGKTEIYCHAIQTVLEARQQVLFLVPEISLTTQLTDRLRRVFGNRLLVYHSKFSDSERVDIWQRLLETHEPLVVLGVRSAIFLPFAKLGLVVVDEEHESSYKQFDPAPRYNGRDAAIMLAFMHGARTLLGSATPAVDTYFKATTEKYGLVTLSERFQGATLPDVEVVDMIEQRQKKLTDGLLASTTQTTLSNTLTLRQQAIIFQNRRGFAPSIYCTQCGWQPKCIHCDVSMVYHKRSDMLNCHYCGYQTHLPLLCPACGQNSVRQGGFGTERIAEHLASHFPQARISRMDLDTTRNKDAYQQIIEDFAQQKTDILIGTQMVSKGLDFANVKFVGVVNADSLLHFPDFRANERAFNMLVQVSGRAGRRDKKGKVIIQTTDAGNPILDFVKTQQYHDYYAFELEQRHQFRYPPFTKIIVLYIKHRSEADTTEIATKYATMLRKIFGERVLGPAKPPIGKLANYYIQTIMLKVEAEASMTKVKHLLHSIYAEMSSDIRMRSAQIYYDVDPA